MPFKANNSRSFSTILIGCLAGFTLSFLIFVIVTHLMWPDFPLPLTLHSQLITGDALKQQYHTSHDVVVDLVNGNNPMAIALSSYFWWIGMTAGGIVAAFFFMRVLERYKNINDMANMELRRQFI